MISSVSNGSLNGRQRLLTKKVGASDWKYPAYVGIGLYALLASPFTVIPRAYSHFTHRSFSEGLEKAQIASVFQSLGIVLQGPDRGKRIPFPARPTVERLQRDIAKQGNAGLISSEAGALAKGTVKLREKIEALQRGDSVWGGIAGLRKDLTALMNLPLYRELKDTDCAAINFLQYVAVKLIAADGNPTLYAYGKKCLGDLGTSQVEPNILADKMSAYLKQQSFTIEHGRLFHSAAHPFRTMHSLESVLDPLRFDGSIGNPNFSAHTFDLGEKKMRFYYGPGPTGNPIFEHGVLPAYRKFGAFEFRFNHQNTTKKDEFVRVKEAVRIAESNPDVLKHAVIGFDIKMDMAKYDSVDSFFDQYQHYIKNGMRELSGHSQSNGFYLSAELFSEKEVDAALEKAREFSLNLSRDNPHWHKVMAMGKSGKMRMAKMMKLIADTCLTLGLLYRSFDMVTPERVQSALDEQLDRDLTAVRTSGACKQNIDRGIVENISLRLFFRWATNSSSLSEKECYEIAGAVLGRARLVEDRNIMMSRYVILDDFLRFVGGSRNGPADAQAVLRGYRDSLLRYIRVL